MDETELRKILDQLLVEAILVRESVIRNNHAGGMITVELIDKVENLSRAILNAQTKIL
jgi:hypothetical protein